MLYRHSEVFRGLLMLADLGLVAAAWTAAYLVRFHTGLATPLGIPGPERYAWTLAFVLPLFTWLLRARRLYEPQRTGSLLREAGAILRASAAGVVLLLAADAALRLYLSRSMLALFFVFASVSLAGSRIAIRSVLRRLRRHGYNLRYVLVIGAGELAEQVIERVNAHPEAGLRVIGALSDDAGLQGRTLQGVPVLAGYAAVKSVMARQRIDQVLIALPREESGELAKILRDLDDEVASVRLVPDLLSVMTLCSTVEELDGLPVINLREGPFVGWAGVQKRAFDLALASLALLLLAPVLLAVALAVWIGSGRPVLYGQERMGLDGRVFRMLKFRTMVREAERESGPVWTRPDDPRRTRLGAFLRRRGLDELPQLLNVLRGEMSLVGPRPERPAFIEQFRREIPGYMRRHKVRSGLTGWAQIHGWRGNTSLHERLEHDLYYIQNWSLGFDVRILLLTLWYGWRDRNGY
jgi:Undecaprenyl-phosphate glucose phosphotransferase